MPTRSFILQDDTELLLNDEVADFGRIVAWGLKGRDATVTATTDPKRSGYCTKLVFTEKPS